MLFSKIVGWRFFNWRCFDRGYPRYLQLVIKTGGKSFRNFRKIFFPPPSFAIDPFISIEKNLFPRRFEKILFKISSLPISFFYLQPLYELFLFLQKNIKGRMRRRDEFSSTRRVLSKIGDCFQTLAYSSRAERKTFRLSRATAASSEQVSTEILAELRGT